MDLWFHDGTGYGWPAVATRRSETTEQAFDEVDAPVGVEVSPGVVEQQPGKVRVPLGHTVTVVLRDLVVFYTGPEDNEAGLKPGVNVFRDVREGAPTEPGTCSHIQWQPGTAAHAEMVLWGLDGDERAARALEHGIEVDS